MSDAKIIVLLVPGGEVRVEWDESVPDLYVKLALARLIQLNLANYGTDRDLGEGVERMPPAGDVVGFANQPKPAAPQGTKP